MDVRNLDGRTVLVTGAASGIGRATALACGRRGASLVLCDVNEAGLADTASQLRALGRAVLTRRVDVSKEGEMREFADVVHGEREAVDLLINNAGVGLGAGFLDTSLEDWEWILGINLRGVILGCHFFIPKMVARGRGGHVVNVSSMAALAPSETLSAYSTTKCAVLGLSEALADELGRHGIGVTAVCPGADRHAHRGGHRDARRPRRPCGAGARQGDVPPPGLYRRAHGGEPAPRRPARAAGGADLARVVGRLRASSPQPRRAALDAAPGGGADARRSPDGSEPVAEGEDTDHGERQRRLGRGAEHQADEGADAHPTGLDQIASRAVLADHRADEGPEQ